MSHLQDPICQGSTFVVTVDKNPPTDYNSRYTIRHSEINGRGDFCNPFKTGECNPKEKGYCFLSPSSDCPRFDKKGFSRFYSGIMDPNDSERCLNPRAGTGPCFWMIRLFIMFCDFLYFVIPLIGILFNCLFFSFFCLTGIGENERQRDIEIGDSVVSLKLKISGIFCWRSFSVKISMRDIVISDCKKDFGEFEFDNDQFMEFLKCLYYAKLKPEVGIIDKENEALNLHSIPVCQIISRIRSGEKLYYHRFEEHKTMTVRGLDSNSCVRLTFGDLYDVFTKIVKRSGADLKLFEDIILEKGFRSIEFRRLGIKNWKSKRLCVDLKYLIHCSKIKIKHNLPCCNNVRVSIATMRDLEKLNMISPLKERVIDSRLHSLWKTGDLEIIETLKGVDKKEYGKLKSAFNQGSKLRDVSVVDQSSIASFERIQKNFDAMKKRVREIKEEKAARISVSISKGEIKEDPLVLNSSKIPKSYKSILLKSTLGDENSRQSLKIDVNYPKGEVKDKRENEGRFRLNFDLANHCQKVENHKAKLKLEEFKVKALETIEKWIKPKVVSRPGFKGKVFDSLSEDQIKIYNKFNELSKFIEESETFSSEEEKTNSKNAIIDAAKRILTQENKEVRVYNVTAARIKSRVKSIEIDSVNTIKNIAMMLDKGCERISKGGDPRGISRGFTDFRPEHKYKGKNKGKSNKKEENKNKNKMRRRPNSKIELWGGEKPVIDYDSIFNRLYSYLSLIKAPEVVILSEKSGKPNQSEIRSNLIRKRIRDKRKEREEKAKKKEKEEEEEEENRKKNRGLTGTIIEGNEGEDSWSSLLWD